MCVYPFVYLCAFVCISMHALVCEHACVCVTIACSKVNDCVIGTASANKK